MLANCKNGDSAIYYAPQACVFEIQLSNVLLQSGNIESGTPGEYDGD